MVALFVLLCILLANSGVESSVFKGKGDACFASYFLNKTGITFIYRPQDYETYSPLGRGWKALVWWSAWKSKRYTKHYYPERVINSNYTVEMFWSDEGKYFYYQQTTGILQPHDWIGYAVYITDIILERIYEDTYSFYKISPDFGFCEIDNRESNQSLCSQALSNATSYQKALMNKPAVTPYKGKGKVYVTGTGWLNLGLRFIYLPENYQLYSPEGQGWIAYVGYYVSTSFEEAKANYTLLVMSRRETWPTMKWDSEGQYYYYDNYGMGLPSSLFGYGVDIVNTDGQTIYEDTYKFYYKSSSNIGQTCALDFTNSSINRCSQVLREKGEVGRPSSNYSEKNKVKDNKGYDGDIWYTDYSKYGPKKTDIYSGFSSGDSYSRGSGSSKVAIYSPVGAGVAAFFFIVGCCAKYIKRQEQRKVIQSASTANQGNGNNGNVPATHPPFSQHDEQTRTTAFTTNDARGPTKPNRKFHKYSEHC